MGNKPQLRWKLIGAAMILIPTITIVLVEILGGLSTVNQFGGW